MPPLDVSKVVATQVFPCSPHAGCEQLQDLPQRDTARVIEVAAVCEMRRPVVLLDSGAQAGSYGIEVRVEDRIPDVVGIQARRAAEPALENMPHQAV